MKFSGNVAKAEVSNSLILASPSDEKLDRWKEGLHNHFHVLHINNLDALKNALGRVKPAMLLLDHDLPDLNGARGIIGLSELSPVTKTVILSGPTSDDEEWDFFRAGVRGCCRNDIDAELLKQVVMSVQQGELWIRRTLTYRLLEQLKENASRKSKNGRASLVLLEKLTHREYEISVRVSNGETNKKIAQSLDITERTVKAHLTEVFLKLGVTDRLKLAMILSEDERKVRRTASSNQ